MTEEDLEAWSGTQRGLPVLIGLVWVAVGALVVALAYPEFLDHWENLPWGIAMMLGGIFVLYIRFSALPSARK